MKTLTTLSLLCLMCAGCGEKPKPVSKVNQDSISRELFMQAYHKHDSCFNAALKAMASGKHPDTVNAIIEKQRYYSKQMDKYSK